MNARNSGRLLLGAVMALALVSYITIAANASKAVGGGIYEMEASKLGYSDFQQASPAAKHGEMTRLAARGARLVTQTQ